MLVIFGWALAGTLALGALAGALNTMYAAVEARTKELATLRAIGFGGMPAFFGAMTESLVLAAAGGLLGGLAAYPDLQRHLGLDTRRQTSRRSSSSSRSGRSNCWRV